MKIKVYNFKSPNLNYSNSAEDNFTVGSLFSGVGGICLGFKQAGFDLVWANEMDSNACKTYLENFDHILYEGKIEDLDTKYLPSADVITSGFPCQAFSIAGYRKGFNDHRGQLFKETMRIINDIKPKAFLLENVKNLIAHDEGRTFRIMQEIVKDYGYSFIPKVMNSMEYGNVPQNRERIYIVGFKDESGYNPESPEEELVCSYNFSFPSSVNLIKRVTDIVEPEVSEEYYYTNFAHYKKLLKYSWEPEIVGQWRRVYVRQNKRNVCPTLTANMGTGGHNVPLVKDSKDIRKLTPKECFMFQGFPKSFKLPKDMANSHLYKQAGNSVTVPVIKRIADRVRKALLAKYSYLCV
ncbi:MAG TPA: DNA (cytosine-5-)-methyltransferase [Candidatus Omnitrophica bacterium]|nr:DNA (cytosine-5-)-methyltransferase [Candidatus Omnitrophota bacterium]